MANKATLLKEINECCLAVLDAGLYLDTHKTDVEALAYFHKHQKKATELKAEYTKNFGPLTKFDCNDDKVFTWVNTIWPWEIEV